MRKRTYFLVYIDILGFVERADKEIKKSGSLTPEEVRNIYRGRVEGRLKELKKKRTIPSYTRREDRTVLHFREMSLDSWLLFTDDIWKAFRSVGEILETNLPFEIAIGVKYFDESPAGEERIALRNETMDYLKSNILSPYKKWYGEKHKKNAEQTFILLTPEAYKELESENVKRIARRPYKSANFYLVKRKEFDRKLEILKFLEKINSKRVEYREIEELYVKPANYKEIERILKDNNIVFIIGDAEIGKTYTAVKLLFEFFKEGFKPIHIPARERREQWKFAEDRFELEGKAVYLEDPWGRVEFETAESFFRDLGDLITEAKRRMCKVIVTSRGKVFKEFEKRKETAEDLWGYVSELRVSLAYSEEDLREMLGRYADVFEPAWLNNKKLREIAFEAAGETLRTPMSIKRLIDYTQDAKDEDRLNAGIAKASEETKIAFSKEIKEMFIRGEYDKLVFLCFAYIEVGPEVAKSCYEEILIDIGYDLIKANDFDDLLKEFNEVDFGFSGEELSYIHPSYEDSFGSALMDDNQPNNISKKIFYKVLSKLSEKNGATSEVVWAIAKKFDKLPEDIRNLLLKFFKKDRTLQIIEEVLVDYLYILQENARNELLLELSENEAAAEYVAWRVAEYVARAVAENFDMLPDVLRNELLLELSQKEGATNLVAMAVAENFDTLPEDIKTLLDLLQDQLQYVIGNLSRGASQNKISSIKLISNAKSKIDKNFAFSILGRLSWDENKEVRMKAKELDWCLFLGIESG